MVRDLKFAIPKTIDLTSTIMVALFGAPYPTGKLLVLTRDQEAEPVDSTPMVLEECIFVLKGEF